MIDEKSKVVFEACPNYDQIINHQMKDQDIRTKRLIHYYEDYIFNINLTDEEEINKITKLDQIIAEYITDYHLLEYFEKNFERKMKENEEKAYFDELVDTIIELYEQYKLDQITKITTPKWIE